MKTYGKLDLRNMDCMDIPGYEGLYSISRSGRVYSYKTKQNLKNIACEDYFRICLCRNGRKQMLLLHRVIAEAFIPNPFGKPCINHIDGDKSNNSLENLEWVTHSENLLHAYETKLNTRPRPVVRVSKNGDTVFYKSARAAEMDGFQNQNIAKCCKGARQTHLGYRWEYAK
jgi:hypothetical protein